MERPKNLWEQKKQEIDEKISRVKQTCFTDKKMEDLSLIVEQFLPENVDIDKLPSSTVLFLASIRDKILNTSGVFLKTLPELRYGLEKMGCTKEYVEEMVVHENAHGNVTDKLGANHIGYNLLVTKSEDGSYHVVVPQSVVYIPDKWGKMRQLFVQREITSAPTRYNSQLSPSDASKIDQINKILNIKK